MARFGHLGLILPPPLPWPILRRRCRWRQLRILNHPGSSGEMRRKDGGEMSARVTAEEALEAGCRMEAQMRWVERVSRAACCCSYVRDLQRDCSHADPLARYEFHHRYSHQALLHLRRNRRFLRESTNQRRQSATLDPDLLRRCHRQCWVEVLRKILVNLEPGLLYLVPQ